LGGPPLLFGWAKPVPVDFGRLRKPKQDMLWVALAGPAANLLMAIMWAITIRFVLQADLGRESFLFQVAAVGIQINLVLMALNLFPLLPLDGGRILFSLLPHQLAWQYGRLEPYGMVILIVLLLTGSLWVLIEPFMALGRWIVRLFI
jgi:Zn-dependent protease